MNTSRALSAPSPWILLPLRLFLSITFIYAGIQKLADPQFLRPGTAGYIGNQLISYVHSSPLSSFLLQVAVPHALLCGLLVAYGEIAIGLGTLVGFLLRPAAFFGLVLSLIFFLSISWRVYPYFYGSDIVFAFCWLTILLNGPRHTGLFTLDEFLSNYWQSSDSAQQGKPSKLLFHLLLGAAYQSRLVYGQMNAIPTASPEKQQVMQGQQAESRRSFLLGALLGGAGTLGLAATTFAWRLLSMQQQTIANSPDAPPTPLPAESASNSTSPSTPAQTTASASGTSTIAQVGAVQKNSAITFTIARSGDPGVLIHLNNGQFVAYDATCTHAGCQVDFDPDSQHLVCPCHGAEFDPAQHGRAVHPPADIPLTALALHVDSATGAIMLKQ